MRDQHDAADLGPVQRHWPIRDRHLHRCTAEAQDLRRQAPPEEFKASKGTTLNLTLSAAASVKAVIYRSGHSIRGECKATAKTGRKCTIELKTLTFTGVTGLNHFKIKAKEIKPASYTLVLTASNPGGTSGKQELTFKVMP